MEYLDPIETARAILAGELHENLDPEEDLEDTAIDADVEVEEDGVEEAYHSKGKMKEMYGKKKLAAQKDHDEDDDEEDEDEVEEAVVDPKSEEDPDLIYTFQNFDMK